jgi:hypothetical protein
MKRIEIIKNLVNEGLSEKTLVNFTDKQLIDLSKRMLGEAVTTVSKTTKYSPTELRGKGIKVDGTVTFNPDGSVAVTGDMKEEKSSPKKGAGKKWIQKAIHSSKKGSLKKALGVKKDETIPSGKLKAAAKKGGKLGQRARLAMTLKKLKEHSETQKWVESLVENKYHSFTSKNEIMDLIKTKLNEVETAAIAMPATKARKGHNGIPEFMSYDAITSSETAPTKEPSTKPTPTKDPGEKTPPRKDPRKDPFRRDTPNPVPNPGPRAGSTIKEGKKKK